MYLDFEFAISQMGKLDRQISVLYLLNWSIRLCINTFSKTQLTYVHKLTKSLLMLLVKTSAVRLDLALGGHHKIHYNVPNP